MMNKNEKSNRTSHASLGPRSCVRNSASPYDDDSEDAGIGTYRFPYFLAVAHSLCQGVSDTDLQDIAQEAWFSYSRRSKEDDISNPEAYIATIIRNKFRDHLRKERRHSPSSIISLSAFTDNPDIELAALSRRRLINSTNELEDQLEKLDFFHSLAAILPKIPPRQRCAIICTMLDKIDDPLLFKQVLKSHHIDVSEMCWPSNKAEKRLLQASLPAARRTLANLMDIDLCQYKQRKRPPHLPTS